MENLNKKLEEELFQKIDIITPLGGGCIGNAMKVTTENGNQYFVKSYEIYRNYFYVRCFLKINIHFKNIIYASD